MKWFTSDHHFGHVNIINLTRRPFHSVDNMNRLLIMNWNEVVAPEDSVYVIGDFAMGKIAETLPLAKQLNGRKYLICGNHDRPWHGNLSSKNTLDKLMGWRKKYEEVGFSVVSNGSLPIQFSNGAVALMNHFPYEGDSHDEDRYVEWRPVDRGRVLLHGHTHSREVVQDKMIHVGVDAWNYYPVPEDEITAIIGSMEVDND